MDDVNTETTVRALRARSREDSTLTPLEVLSRASEYTGGGNGGLRSWLQFTAAGLGVSVYSSLVASTDGLEPILNLLSAIAGDELTVINVGSPTVKGVPLLRGAQSEEALYVLGSRGFAYIQRGFDNNSYNCLLDLFHSDFNEKELKALNEFVEHEKSLQQSDKTQRIYMLVDYGNGDFNFHSNKIPLSSFKTENYSEENVSWMPKLKEGLFSPTSVGRLTILQGPAGTGKTRFLRGLMQEMGSGTVSIVLPVSLSGELAQPRMLGQITANDAFENKNLLLIIEDGDGLLEKRDRANSVISDFLNIVDGLVGEIVNLHVVVTTNLQKQDFDPAITRPGRLHSILYFEPLPYEQASKVYKRETGEDMPREKEEYTLAEVYALANNHGNGVRKKEQDKSAGQYL